MASQIELISLGIVLGIGVGWELKKMYRKMKGPVIVVKDLPEVKRTISNYQKEIEEIKKEYREYRQGVERNETNSH